MENCTESTPKKKRRHWHHRRNLEDRLYSFHEFRSCASKLRHAHALTALQHAFKLGQVRPLAKIAIYPCEYCDGMHVTTSHNDNDYSKLENSLHKLERIMSHPNFALRAPVYIQGKYTKMLADIQVRMLELEERHAR